MKKIKITEYCKKSGCSEAEILERLRKKEVEGGPEMGVWYVALDENEQLVPASAKKETELKEKPKPIKPIPETLKPKKRTAKRDISVSTLDYISGKTIEEIGIVSVSIVESMSAMKTLGAEIRSQTIGGRSNSLSQFFDRTRDALLDEIKERAYKMRADAVIGVRFSSSEILSKGIELMAYWTAVNIINIDE